MIFYAWCGISFFLLILFSASLAYGFGLWIEQAEAGKKRRILFLALGFHLGVLVCCKYLSSRFPLGISFYTFSILSYLLDVYWEKCRAQKQIVHVWLYVLFFPKVVQGPIMRYSLFEAQLFHRKVDLEAFRKFGCGCILKVFDRRTASLSDAVESFHTFLRYFLKLGYGCILKLIKPADRAFFKFTDFRYRGLLKLIDLLTGFFF